MLNLMLNAFAAMSGRKRGRVGDDGDGNGNGDGDGRRVAQDLTIRTRLIDGSRLLIEVIDSGSGIAADQLKRIFDPFVTSKPDGLGMGLSICRSIIQGHRGQIWAVNNPDRGATFSITLPAAAREAERVAEAR
jgi:signal transduction histidine kinase